MVIEGQIVHRYICVCMPVCMHTDYMQIYTCMCLNYVFIHLCVVMCMVLCVVCCVYCVVSMCVCHRAYTDVRGQVFSFLLYHVGPRDGAEVVSLSCRYLYPLSMNS